ncbi:MAG: diacylglycerol kinase family protein [Porphyromonas sp.]|nr:diacylglycerol kinase family protein [Porphyromonas sp.]
MKHKRKQTFNRQRIRDSFGYAWQGVLTLFRHTANARIHLLFAIGVVLAGLFFHVTKGEWIALILCITAVLSLEAINSALENLSDQVSPDYSPLIRDAKDLSAGAVLIAAIGSAIIGLIIFIPYLF